MKKFLSVILLAVFVANLLSTPVGVEKAKIVAHKWLKAQNEYRGLSRELTIKDSYIHKSENSIVFYVFNFSPEGFAVVAADDAALPILGYNYIGTTSLGDLGENTKEFFSSYEKSILEIQRKRLSNEQTLKHWNEILNNDLKFNYSAKTVNPLISTLWDQGSPWNAQCPEDAAGPGGRVYAGCVAVAMAQIAKYWSFPSRGVGSHSYNHATYGTLSANFEETTYDWNSMPTTTSSTATAQLLHHLGIAVNMNYSPNGSGASTSDAVNALVNYFKYNDSANFVSRSSYTEADWINLLKSQLNDSIPLLYRGDGDAGGHAFNCDGYDASDYFHFNWGWSGSYNGYFNLNNLNPGTYTFTDYQATSINLYPNYAPTNLTATGGNNNVILKWESAGGNNLNGYKVYRNGSAITGTITGLNYFDSGVNNGIKYTYHVTAISQYGESTPSDTVTATPHNGNIVQIGSGNDVQNGSAAGPINIYYKSMRGQTVYTASEINAAGYTGAGEITALGFYVEGAPASALPSFVVRMKHTNATNAAAHDYGPFETVYTNSSYNPSVGGWDMLNFNTPFAWDGVSNILIDTAFDLVPNYSSSGRVRITNESTNGYKYCRSDGTNQTNATTTSSANYKPQALLFITRNGGGSAPTATTNDASSITLYNATLNGCVNANSANTTIVFEYGPTTSYGQNINANPDTITGTSITTVMAVPNGLTANTLYNYRIVAFNSYGITYGDNKTFTTLNEDDIVTIFSEDFESAPNNWTYGNSTNPKCGWEWGAANNFGSSQYWSFAAPLSGSKFMGINSDDAGSGNVIVHDYLISPVINLENSSNVSITYDYCFLDDGSIANASIMKLLYRTSLANNWVEIKNYDDVEQKVWAVDENIAVPDAALCTTTQFAIEYDDFGNWAYGGGVDNFKVKGIISSNIYNNNAIKETTLSQNYPNPFNPTTTINFALPSNGKVLLTIYNAKGEMVKELVNSQLKAGAHSVKFDGSGFNSGMYFYKLVTPEKSLTKKMLMLK